MTSDRNCDNANEKKYRKFCIGLPPFPPVMRLLLLLLVMIKINLDSFINSSVFQYLWLMTYIFLFLLYKGLWEVFFPFKESWESVPVTQLLIHQEKKKNTTSLLILYYIRKTIYTAMIFWNINYGLDYGIQLWMNQLHYLRWGSKDTWSFFPVWLLKTFSISHFGN